MIPIAVLAAGLTYIAAKAYLNREEAKDIIDNINRKLKYYQAEHRLAVKELKAELKELEDIYNEIYHYDFKRFENLLIKLNKKYKKPLKNKKFNLSEKIKIDYREIELNYSLDDTCLFDFSPIDSILCSIEYLFTSEEKLTELKEIEREGMLLVSKIQDKTLEIKTLTKYVKQYRNYLLKLRKRFISLLDELENKDYTNLNFFSKRSINKKISAAYDIAETLKDLMSTSLDENLKRLDLIKEE